MLSENRSPQTMNFQFSTAVTLKTTDPWATTAHMSETATADMQMACNIFPILSNIETYDKAMA